MDWQDHGGKMIYMLLNHLATMTLPKYLYQQ
jgi:hypothetical protein